MFTDRSVIENRLDNRPGCSPSGKDRLRKVSSARLAQKHRLRKTGSERPAQKDQLRKTGWGCLRIGIRSGW
ncbi:MAG: hypothetical protein EBZ36_13275 [Acidobacteria bacterium]|nr:hypothetical protein [Acidobacteriota bacterium]